MSIYPNAMQPTQHGPAHRARLASIAGQVSLIAMHLRLSVSIEQRKEVVPLAGQDIQLARDTVLHWDEHEAHVITFLLHTVLAASLARALAARA
jgi:hypothetical protein